MNRTLRTTLVGLLWLVTVLETALMALAGSAKFTGSGPEVWGEMFVGWGYPLWLTWVIGAAEVGFSLLLLVPRLAAWGAAVLVVIMLGALGTVVVHDSPLGVTGPMVHLVALAIILAARWRVRWLPGSPSAGGEGRSRGGLAPATEDPAPEPR